MYVDLQSKSDKELVNLAIVKIKMEDDFVAYKLNNYFHLMKELGLISEAIFNKMIYGTNDRNKISLMRLGIPINIISLLERDQQLINIEFDKNKNIQIKPEFHFYREKLDTFIQFQLDRFI